MEQKRFEKEVWFSSPTMHGPELEYVEKANDINRMSKAGENINEVEHLGCGRAVALSAGTAALHMAVKLWQG